MMSRTRQRVVGLGLGVVVAVAMAVPAAVLAGPRRPLPDVTLLGSDGQAVSIPRAVAQQQVVLIYLVPGAPGSDRLLEALARWDPAPDFDRIVLVVDGQSAEAGQWLATRWRGDESRRPQALFDVDGRGREALQIRGAPMLLGVADGEIRWELAGVLNDPAQLEGPVRAWTTARR